MTGKAGLDKIVVVDIETTCWEKRERDQIMEVIEVGLCLLDIGSGEITDRQSILVKPVYSGVSEFCTKLATLTQELVETGIRSREACLKLEDEYQSKTRVWASYGDFDRRQLRGIRAIRARGENILSGKDWAELKEWAAKVDHLKEAWVVGGLCEAPRPQGRRFPEKKCRSYCAA